MQEIRDLSFIIITRNEEFAIGRCLGAIANMKLENCEVICIDSDSSDQTLTVIKNFKSTVKELRIFKIKGYANAAIARNVGIKKASKKFIFFLDGDVEPNEVFIKEGLSKIAEGYDAVTADLEEFQYEEGYSRVIKKLSSRFAIKQNKRAYISGGCFLAHSKIIETVGLFDERLEHSQDNDFVLRLTKTGKMLALGLKMGTHHTIPYSDKSRIKDYIAKKYPVYMGMVFRRNLLNFKGLAAHFMDISYGMILGLCLLFLYLVFFIIFRWPIDLFMVIAFISVDLIYGIMQGKQIIHRFFLHYVYSMFFLSGFFININPLKEYSVLEVD